MSKSTRVEIRLVDDYLLDVWELDVDSSQLVVSVERITPHWTMESHFYQLDPEDKWGKYTFATQIGLKLVTRDQWEVMSKDLETHLIRLLI